MFVSIIKTIGYNFKISNSVSTKPAVENISYRIDAIDNYFLKNMAAILESAIVHLFV